MVSELQQQLKRIQNPEFVKGTGRGINTGKQLPSILFDRKTAARNDLAAVHEIGKNGFKELVALDLRFLDFEDILFSIDCLETDRVLMNKEWNDQLDQSLELFLHLLSKYFLMRPATMVLEWLVRRFRINEFNVEQVLACILPYYETNEFLLVLRTLFFDSYPRWQWLVLVRKSESPLTRSYFVRQLRSDLSLLKFVCQTIQSFMNHQMGFTTLLNFYTTSLIEFLEPNSGNKVDENALTVLIPSILHGLGNASSEYNLCTYLILSQLGNRVTFSERSLSQIVSTLIANSHAPKKYITMNLLSLAQSQSNFSFAIVKCDLTWLLSESTLPYFKEIAQKFNCEALIKSVSLQLIEKRDFDALLLLLATPGLDIPTSSLKSIFLSLLQLVKLETHLDQVTNLFSRLHGRYGTILEEVVSTFISNSNDTHVFKLIQQCLGTTVHAIVQDTGTSILLAIQHPNDEFSLAGVKQLITVLSTATSPPMPKEDATVLANAVLHCLRRSTETRQCVLDSKLLLNFILEHAYDAAVETLLWLGSHCPSVSVVQASAMAFASQSFNKTSRLCSQLSLMLLHFTIIEKEWCASLNLRMPDLNLKSIQQLLSSNDYVKSGLLVIDASNFNSNTVGGVLKHFNHPEKEVREKAIQLALSYAGPEHLDQVLLKLFSLPDSEFTVYSQAFYSKFPSHDSFAFCAEGLQSSSPNIIVRCLTCLRTKMASTPKDYQSLLLFLLPCFLNQDHRVRHEAKKTLHQLHQALLYFDVENTPRSTWPAPLPPLGYAVDKISFVKPKLLAKWLEQTLELDLVASPANVSHFTFRKKFDTVLVAFLSHLPLLPLPLQREWLVLLQPQQLPLIVVTLHKHYKKLFFQLGPKPTRCTIDVILHFLKCIHPSMAAEMFKVAGVFDTFKQFLARYSVLEYDEVQLCTLKLIQHSLWTALSFEQQYELFNLLLTIVSKSKSSENVLEAKTALTRIPLAESIVGRFLTTFITLKQTQEPALALEPTKKKQKLFSRSKHMSKLIALLELLKYKTFDAYHVLVQPLFQALDLVLQFKPQAHSHQHDFITQLILSDLLLADMSSLHETVFRVELLVECLRSSDNPQTRNSALLVLSKIAPLCPDKVLLNIMPIFTFMGLHVSKQDDEFSFNTIESTIQSIVPSLSLDVVHVQQVVQVFVDTVLHIPIHRRLRLFTTLVKTLGAEQLFMVILLLLEKNVQELFEFALLISSEFPEPMQLRAMIKLITLFNLQNTRQQQQQQEASTNIHVHLTPTSHQARMLSSPVPKSVSCMIHSPPLTDVSDLQSTLPGSEGEEDDDDGHSSFIEIHPPSEPVGLPLTAYFEAIDPSFLIKVKASVLNFVHENLTLRSFAEAYIKVESASDAKTLIQVLLEFIQSYVTEKELLSVASTALVKIQTLLPIRDFVSVMCELWGHASVDIVKKALRLFHERLLQLNAMSVKKHRFAFLDAVPLICQTLERESKDVEISQLCFSLLQQLCMRYGSHHPQPFLATLPLITSYFQGPFTSKTHHVVASAYACFAHYLSKLQHHLLACFNGVMQSSFLFFAAIHTHALHRLSVYLFWEHSVQYLHAFVSPFLGQLLQSVLEFPMPKNKLVSEKTGLLVTLLGEKLEHRLLLPSLYAYLAEKTKLTDAAQAPLFLPDHVVTLLVSMMRPVLHRFTKQDYVQYHDPVFHRFFLVLFDCTPFPTPLLTHCFVPFVLRLNESLFRPLFQSLVAWSQTHPARRLTVLFRTCSALCASLRHLFVGYFAGTALDLLPLTLAHTDACDAALGALATACRHDRDGLVSARVASVCGGFLAATMAVHPDATVAAVVALAQSAGTSGADTVWRALVGFLVPRLHAPHAVEETVVALRCLGQLFGVVGEPFLVYLPETLPGLAECLEVEGVEGVAAQVVKEIEEVMGESLQKYLQK